MYVSEGNAVKRVGVPCLQLWQSVMTVFCVDSAHKKVSTRRGFRFMKAKIVHMTTAATEVTLRTKMLTGAG